MTEQTTEPTWLDDAHIEQISDRLAEKLDQAGSKGGLTQTDMKECDHVIDDAKLALWKHQQKHGPR